MKTLVIVLLGISAMAGLAAWSWYARCERACVAADRRAQDLFQCGEFLSVLELIDDVDRRYNCARFTSGDAPPQYALAQACLRRLLNNGRSADVEQVLANARGTILKELSNRNGINQL